jgi:hypothetical protein
MADGGFIATIVTLQSSKCVLAFLEKKDPIDDCGFAIVAVRPAIDGCKLTIDAVLTYLDPANLRLYIVNLYFTSTYGRVR